MELSDVPAALDAAIKLIDEAEIGWKADWDRVKELEARHRVDEIALQKCSDVCMEQETEISELKARIEKALVHHRRADYFVDDTTTRILRGEGT